MTVAPTEIIPQNRKRWIAAETLISLGIIGFLSWRFDGTAAIELLARPIWGHLTLALALLTAQMFLHTAAWRALLSAAGVDIAYRPVLRITLVSLFFNQAVPASLGGVGARVFYAHRLGAPLRAAASSVIAERFLFLVALAGLSLATLPWLTELVGASFDTTHVRIIAVGIAVVIICAVAVIGYGRRRIRNRPDGRTAAVWQSLLDISARPVQAAVAFVLLIFYHFLSFAAAFFFGLAYGLEADFATFAILIPHVLLIAAIPVSINGWGVREAAMIGLFSLAGFPETPVLAMSVGLGAGLLVTRMPFGLLLPGLGAQTLPKT